MDRCNSTKNKKNSRFNICVSAFVIIITDDNGHKVSDDYDDNMYNNISKNNDTGYNDEHDDSCKDNNEDMFTSAKEVMFW